jgi:hypothetical protein
MVGGEGKRTKVTTVTDEMFRKFPDEAVRVAIEVLVEISQRAGSGAARVATGAATAAGGNRRT